MAVFPKAHNIQRIRRASRFFIGVLYVIAGLVPAIVICAWLFINEMPEVMQRNVLPEYARMPLPPSAQLMGFAVSLIPLAVFFFAVANLIRLFRLYERGQIFRSANVRCFRNLSRALIAWCIAGIVSVPLTSLALTFHHPPGERMVTFGLGSNNLIALLIGGILAIISWVMEEGSSLQEEHDLTV